MKPEIVHVDGYSPEDVIEKHRAAFRCKREFEILKSVDMFTKEKSYCACGSIECGRFEGCIQGEWESKEDAEDTLEMIKLQLGEG